MIHDADADSGFTMPPERPRYRPPVGLPEPRQSRVPGVVASVAIHLLIILLLVAPVIFARAVVVEPPAQAGGAGPAGGGGGGARGSGGKALIERLHYFRIAPATAEPVPSPPAPVPPPVVPPVQEKKPEVTPPAPAQPAQVVPAPVAGAGGAPGPGGDVGAGPGTGGGTGSGVGTGTGSGAGPGTGGGSAEVFPPTLTQLALLPLPVPGKVRPYTMTALFDVDERGNARLISFTPSRDGGYNRRIMEMLREIRFRPAVRRDGTPVRDTAVVTAIAP